MYCYGSYAEILRFKEQQARANPGVFLVAEPMRELDIAHVSRYPGEVIICRAQVL